MGWFESPQYLKNMQKIKALGPEDKAITQTLANELSGLYADADMQKQLQAIRFATGAKEGERALKLGQQRLDLSKLLGEGSLGLARKQLSYDKSTGKTGEMLGWGNIALSGLMGWQDMKYRKEEAERDKALMKKLFGSK